ncbi:AAC(3) family N-acetyltransferase [Streptomyces sp. NPDC058155]|uniref:AAC(3) family N-acetyltransferase n=1 Tax=Streptomyces sp. NPDC058155 TaxID=3346359 RepID=UPI0036E3F252
MGLGRRPPQPRGGAGLRGETTGRRARGPVQQVPAYTVDSTVLNVGNGVLPARLLARPDAERGLHPLNSFAALGPWARELAAARARPMSTARYVCWRSATAWSCSWGSD